MKSTKVQFSLQFSWIFFDILELAIMHALTFVSTILCVMLHPQLAIKSHSYCKLPVLSSWDNAKALISLSYTDNNLNLLRSAHNFSLLQLHHWVLWSIILLSKKVVVYLLWVLFMYGWNDLSRYWTIQYKWWRISMFCIFQYIVQVDNYIAWDFVYTVEC